MADLAARIVALKETAAKAQKMRSDCTAAQEFAKTQLTKIDEELTQLGINPEHAETELAALETQLDVTTTQLQQALANEVAELEAILVLARQAQLIR
jgi:chromosome segregation ATPase